ncbi:MAG: TonB-dependent receptor [Vicinamibacteraceae bacterium]
MFYKVASVIARLVAIAAAIAIPTPSLGQTPVPAGATATEDDTLRFKMPTVTVTAQKQPEDRQKVPVSVTAVTRETIDAAGIRLVSDAAILAPNTVFTEWTARKLSNARFRGISSSPNNPGITTYIDGVPQLNANSSSIELLDVDQIEFVRGPQSALFGRNTLGGLVNVTSSRPSMTGWTGSLTLPVANHGAWTVRGGVSGPVVKDRLAVGFSVAQVSRDGFTVNDITGNDIDTRSAFSIKGQLLFTPNVNWETRVIVTGERARDGDYGLNDVAALRASPFHAARDFEGFANRDIFGTTIHVRRTGGPLVFSSTTGIVKWTTQDVTDLDYTPAPLIQRDNTEDDLQFTQELRVASSEQSPIELSDNAKLRWQAGVFFFTQGYQQDAVNSFSPGLVAPFPVAQHSPRSALDDSGVGLFGQATVTLGERLDLSAGARFDHESKDATLETFFDPQLAPPSRVDAEKGFSSVSPQVSAAYRLRPEYTVYATVGRGFKAGGFNSASPSGREAYDEEQTWNIEGGIKTVLAGGRVTANAAVFHIDWDDLQLNVPDPAVPAQFFISNVGGATSKGVEFELAARAAPGLDLFAAIGYTKARFGAGSVSGPLSIEGNTLPNTPDHTVSVGGQYARVVGSATAFGRIDMVRSGSFQYDDANSLGQDAYALVHLRGGYTAKRWLAELFVRNAFDTEYLPLAFPYPNFAPSGFVGELGAPRTIGASVGVRF